MDLAKILVDQSTNLWSDMTWSQAALAFIVLWALVYKFGPVREYLVLQEVMEYLGLVVIALVTALAFAYGGWVGLGALAFVIAVR